MMRPIWQACFIPATANQSRDGLGLGVKFAVPTIANGKVYAASTGTVEFTGAEYGQLNVFGLLASAQYADPPVFSPAPGLFSGTFQVTITAATPGAVIYYTTDGTVPTASSARYTGSIAVSSNETITAVASATGLLQGPPVTAVYSSHRRFPTRISSQGTASSRILSWSRSRTNSPAQSSTTRPTGPLQQRIRRSTPRPSQSPLRRP